METEKQPSENAPTPPPTIYILESQESADIANRIGLAPAFTPRTSSRIWKRGVIDGCEIVILLPDTDACMRESVRIKRRLSRAAFSITRLFFTDITDIDPPFRAEDTLLDIIAAGMSAKTVRLAVQTFGRVWQQGDEPDLGDTRPIIEVNGRELADITEQTRPALIAVNSGDPRIFVRDGRLVHINRNENGTPVIEETQDETLVYELARAAKFVSTSETRGTVPVVPRKDIISDLREDLKARAWRDVPALESIVTAPIVAPSGELVMRPGYLPEARAYYHGEEMTLPATEPTPANVTAAKALLLGTILCDFPFKDEASRAHALALILCPFVRQVIKGPTPAYLIDAPLQGSGKSLLAETCCSVFAGRADATVIPKRGEEDEWRKALTSALKNGSPFVWFDNLKTRLDSGPLAHAITASYWTDREMGLHRTITLPVRCYWVITGNNIECDGDFPRRSVWIRLDSQTERPEDREGFKIADLRAFATENRPALVAACLTLIRAWLAAGSPSWRGKLMGSFESYCRVLGGILDTIGVPGFLANREELYERADPERDRWAAFFASWFEKHKDAAVSVGDVIELAKEAELVADTERGSRNHFGRAIRGKQDAIIGGYRLTKEREVARVARYSMRLHTTPVNLWESVSSVSNVSTVPPYVGVSKNNTDTTNTASGIDTGDTFDTHSPEGMAAETPFLAGDDETKKEETEEDYEEDAQ